MLHTDTKTLLQKLLKTFKKPLMLLLRNTFLDYKIINQTDTVIINT
jgi:hypothetical protein